MGELLNYVESFSWEDKTINRSISLQNYNIALNEARSASDNVYCPGAMFCPENQHNIFLFMWTHGYQSHESLKNHFSWLTSDDFQLLLGLYNRLGKQTPNSSNTWEEFSNEFNEKNKSLIGLRDDNCLNPLVHDKVTHEKFHSSHAASFDFDDQKKQFMYFKKYYKPYLKTESAQIENQIKRNQVNKGIIRLDPPTTSSDGTPIHGQKIHIHILIAGKKCALNIDGTWKHPPNNVSTNRIPAEICLTLSKWGFCLPDDYYT